METTETFLSVLFLAFIVKLVSLLASSNTPNLRTMKLFILLHVDHFVDKLQRF